MNITDEREQTMSKFLVKERRPDGFYRNPYKKGGRAIRWTKWKTVSSHENIDEATKAAIVTVGLACRAVFYKGERISNGPRLKQWWIDEQKRLAAALEAVENGIDMAEAELARDLED